MSHHKQGFGAIALILTLMSCSTLKNFLPTEEGGEPMHDEHPELCQVTKSKEVKYPPVVMTYGEKKLHREIAKIRKKVLKDFPGVPSHWFDFDYDVDPQPDGVVLMKVTACMKAKYVQEFEDNRQKLYEMLGDGA